MGARAFVDSHGYLADHSDEVEELVEGLGEECAAVAVAMIPLSLVLEAPFVADLEEFYPGLGRSVRDTPRLVPSDLRPTVETLASISEEALDVGGMEAAGILDTAEYDEARRQVSDWFDANC